MDDMPMFDDPITKQDAPKKQKPKPTRKRRRKIAVARKQRTARSYTLTEAATLLTPKTMQLISALMNLEIPLRNFVMEVTKALTK